MDGNYFSSLARRRVWIGENAGRPVVTVTGSHRHSCLFGVVSLDGKQLFRQYDTFDENTFYGYLKQIHHKFPKCYLFLDKASPHYKSQKVRSYFDEHKRSLIPIWLLTASPEFMIDEKNVGGYQRMILPVLTYYQSFTEFKRRIGLYFRTKRFKLNMRNYLVGGMSA